MAFFLSRGLFDGEPKTKDMVNILRWEHDFVFPFDLNNPFMARLFLERLRINGELLARKNSIGLPYTYNFYRLGGSGGIMNVYPSYDRDNRKLPIWHYGRIDILQDIYEVGKIERMVIDEEVLRRDENTNKEPKRVRPFVKDDKFVVEQSFIDNGLRSNWTGRRDKVTVLLNKKQKKEEKEKDVDVGSDILGFNP